MVPPNVMTGPSENIIGPLRAVVGEYDGMIFIPPTDFFTDGTFTLTRTAAGNYFQSLAGAGATQHIWARLTSFLNKWGADVMEKFGSNFGVAQPIRNPYPLQPSSVTGAINQQIANDIPPSAPSLGSGTYPFATGHNIRGLQIVGYDLFYGIGTAGMTSVTPTLYQRLMANLAAPTITTPGGAITYRTGGPVGPIVAVPPVATTTANQPNQLTVLLGTPYIIGNNAFDTDDWLEIAAVNPGSSVFQLYGCYLYVNYNLL